MGAKSPVDDPASQAAELDGLSEEQRAWALHSEALWRRAHEIARSQCGIDPGDVYHALRCLERSPSERLRRGLGRGRLRARAG